MKKILYIQYTNPACYPPLEHSAKFFAGQDYRVFFLGTKSFSSSGLVVETHQNITVNLLAYCPPGFFQKAHFLYFCLKALWQAILFKPSWIYLSEVMSTPAGILISLLTRTRLIYHEHDSPSTTQAGLFMKLIMAARHTLAVKAELCILPNDERLNHFIRQTGRTKPTLCVWNCPSLEEVQEPKASLSPSDTLVLYYHGSITPERLPLTVIDALERQGGRMHLWVAGYETLGSEGYLDIIKTRVEQLNLRNSFKVLGAIPQRKHLISQMRCAHVGLSFMPKDSADINMKNMAGASNKPFDYLAGGLVLLVTDIPAWEELYVKPGYALSCDPDSVDSVAQCLQWFSDHPEDVRKMGAAGRQKILSEWNYEEQFMPVMRYLQCV